MKNHVNDTIKYFSQLEKPNEYVLPLIRDLKPFSLYGSKIPVPYELYIRYNDLFCYLRDFNKLYYNYLIINCNDSFKREEIKEKLTNKIIKECFDNQNKLFYSDEEYQEKIYFLELFSDYGQLLYINAKKLNNLKNISIQELSKILNFYYQYIPFFSNFKDKEKYNLLREARYLFNNISQIATIKCDKSLNIKLPNSWYICPKLNMEHEYIYNTTGKNGHKEATLEYPWQQVFDGINLISSNPLSYIDVVKSIEERKGVTYKEFRIVGWPSISFPNLELYNNEDIISHNKQIIDFTTGIYMAHAAFFDFFNRLKRLSGEQYNQNLSLLRNLSLDDLLVQCCGFHKVNSSCEKTITTSSLNYEESFKEYIQNGWKIDYVSKIIIVKEKLYRIEKDGEKIPLENYYQKDNGEKKLTKSYPYTSWIIDKYHQWYDIND